MIALAIICGVAGAFLLGLWLSAHLRASSSDAARKAMQEVQVSIIKGAAEEKLRIETAAQRDIAKIKIQTDEELLDELKK